MTSPEKDEIISLALALEDVGNYESTLGVRGLRFMCRQAAQMIRRLRPDLSFIEKTDGQGADK